LLEEEQERMVAGVFDFGEHRVSQVMTPRTELDAIAVATPWPEVVRRVATSRHQRLPIYADDLDHILGVVYAKDVLRALTDPQQGPGDGQALLRPVPFVPESLPLDKLMVELRRHKAHLAIALDEFGGTAGLVTLEDLVEEIVGEVGEGGSAEAAVECRADGSIALDGLLPLEDVNERVGLGLEDPHYETLGGYVFGRLGRMPSVGDELILPAGQRLRVDALDGARVARVVVTLPEAPAVSHSGMPR
jgi:CBS domain containing-hemolysin-like protein